MESPGSCKLEPSRAGGLAVFPASRRNGGSPGRGIEAVTSQKMDVGAIFTTFDESQGARTSSQSINDSVEASYITFMTPIFIFIFHICIFHSLSDIYFIYHACCRCYCCCCCSLCLYNMLSQLTNRNNNNNNNLASNNSRKHYCSLVERKELEIFVVLFFSF